MKSNKIFQSVADLISVNIIVPILWAVLSKNGLNLCCKVTKHSSKIIFASKFENSKIFAIFASELRGDCDLGDQSPLFYYQFSKI